jgi:hypothetical protein
LVRKLQPQNKGKSILRIGIITNIIFGAQEAQNFDFFDHFFGLVKKCRMARKT